ncbi:uncharacterized protein RJT21DRAFT_119920 [Scheffersomyces amazonensis]|uniref:uncharacterized protein n=1 Tax=Scheffersomyces amazonensis TaxID=1078765 RepID=UPI00315DA2A0
MAIFRSKSNKPGRRPTNVNNIDVKISSKDERDFQMNSSSVHDPILTAVNEAQPFEQAADRTLDNRRPSYLSQGSHDLKDIFGTPIDRPDVSNPTRARNERPLDTIRGFEYAITGDLSYRDQLETHRLGWGFHEDFPHYNLQATVPGAVDPVGGSGSAGLYQAPAANFDQAIYQNNNYSASSLRHDGKKKKKGGLFGRKK